MSETIKFGEVWLAEESDAVSAFLLDGKPVAQMAGGLRAATVTAINRRNRARTVNFVVTRRPLDTPASARLFLFQHELALEAEDANESPVAQFRFESVAGGSFVFDLNDCVLTHRGEARGVTTIHTYTLTGGVLEVPPTT
jgi:hypothetical protein